MIVINYFKECYENGGDFYEMSSGNLFHISEYKRLKDFGLPNPWGGMRVSDGLGHIIGIVSDENVEKILNQRD